TQELMISFLVFGFIKTIISVSFSASLSYLLYGYNVFDFGLYLIPFSLSLLMTGWAFGFIIAGFIIRFGTRIQTMAWAGAALLSPFSAAFYPISALPSWAQTIAKAIPASYIFEEMRSLLFTGKVEIDKLILSFALNIIYLIISMSFFIFMFRKSKQHGIGNLV
ncbi:MAG: ABC transporter permease, partial [Patescibacteria group bacterium]